MYKTALENRTWNRLVSGTPTVVIENGKILDDNMRKLRYMIDSLAQSLREKDIFNMEEIEYACLEEQVLRQWSKSVSDVFYAVRGTQNQLYLTTIRTTLTNLLISYDLEMTLMKIS